MNLLKSSSILVVLVLLLATSCKNEPHFVVEGIVSGAHGDTLYLEKRGLTKITVLDSAVIAEDGSFKIKGLAEEYPELYLLRLKNQVINLSVDSVETIRVESTKEGFALDYKVEGSDASARIKDVLLAQLELGKTLDLLKKQYQAKSISETEYMDGVQAGADNYKTKVKKYIMLDLTSPAAYFALFQKIGESLILDPYDKNDSKMYSAVATAWDRVHEGNPRTKHLHDFTINVIKERRSAERTVSLFDSAGEVVDTDYYSIDLPNINGKKIALSSLRGKVVVLDFTAYQTDYSPAHNIAINKVYQKYKDNVEVYQVSLDSDIHFWKNAAVNLPWICVRDDESLASNLIYKFNVQALPSIFILGKEGNIVKRLLPSDDLETEIKKLI